MRGVFCQCNDFNPFANPCSLCHMGCKTCRTFILTPKINFLFVFCNTKPRVTSLFFFFGAHLVIFFQLVEESIEAVHFVEGVIEEEMELWDTSDLPADSRAERLAEV